MLVDLNIDKVVNAEVILSPLLFLSSFVYFPQEWDFKIFKISKFKLMSQVRDVWICFWKEAL